MYLVVRGMGHRDGNLEGALLLALIVVIAVSCVISAVRGVSVVHATTTAILVDLNIVVDRKYWKTVSYVCTTRHCFASKNIHTVFIR